MLGTKSVARNALYIPVQETRSPRDTSGAEFLNYAPNSYLERTSRPVYAIVFLLPLLLFYELGTYLVYRNGQTLAEVRVMAFVWLKEVLGQLGYQGYLANFAPPLVVIVVLLGLQIASRKPWYFLKQDVGPMVLECVLLAIPLIVLSLFINSHTLPPDETANSLSAGALVLQASSEAVRSSLFAQIITGVGAGIYEELVFRLILISVLMLVLQDILRVHPRTAIIVSVLVSAALFSAHHHVILVNGHFDQMVPFSWTAFCFRTMAGVYFAVLFALRGFGIAAGTHAFYDIIATCLNAAFFTQ